MGDTIGESQGFLRTSIAHVSPSRPVGEALEEAVRLHSPVFVINKPGEPDDVVDAARFARILVEKGVDAKTSFRDLLGRKIESVRELVDDAHVATISGTRLDASDQIAKAQATEAHIVEREGLEVGLFFSNDLLSKITTRPPVFICANRHRNNSFSDGTCGRCPAPIVSTE